MEIVSFWGVMSSTMAKNYWCFRGIQYVSPKM